MAPIRIVALEGDQTGQELLEQSLRVLDPEVIGLEVELDRFDLSLENRRATGNAVVREAAAAMRETGLGLKAATITPEGADDVGSPNRILREGIDGKVIVRTGRRIPGVTPVAGVHHPISVCRMAVGDAYGAEQWRERDGRRRGRPPDRDDPPLRLPRRRRVRVPRAPSGSAGRVYGGPKWTVSPVYEGMLKEEMDAAAERHPDVAYEPVLIDATLAGLVTGAATEPLVIPCLNRDGDLLSDLVLPLFGSIAGAESVLLGARRRAADHGRDGRGAARHRAGARGQGRRQPDGDDPRRRGAPPLRRRAPAPRAPRPRRGRSTRRCWRRPPPASAPPTSAATRAPPSSPTP